MTDSTNDVKTPQPLISSAEAAIRLGTTERHLRRLHSERRLPYVKVGKVVRFRPEDIDDFIWANRVEAVGREVPIQEA